ncbi:hypothetical protein QF027_009236 [Streptomyces canus]|nr:hypothetical protein [Streptomyces canus]
MLGSMTANVTPNELGEFPKKRRSELSPRTVGLPETGRLRRVAGLRREEVAQLASISTDHSTRLEQGRMQASAPVLATLTAKTHPDQHLTVWTTAPGSPTHERLRILASWAAGRHLPASPPLT